MQKHEEFAHSVAAVDNDVHNKLILQYMKFYTEIDISDRSEADIVSLHSGHTMSKVLHAFALLFISLDWISNLK